jgi:hypothetical protein
MRAGNSAVLLLAATALIGSTEALAHGHFYGPRVHFGVVVGGPPLYWHYPPPYYYAPPAIVVPASPPTYIEKNDASESNAQSFWYWCADARAYYPYVKQCAGGWQRVTPQAAPGG